MNEKRMRNSRTRGVITIQLILVGLVVTCLALVVVVGLLAFSLLRSSPDGNAKGSQPDTLSNSAATDIPPTDIPPWGEMIVSDIELEQPEEYVAFEIETNRIPTWVFAEMTPDTVRALMLSCGMPAEQVARALSRQLAEATVSGTVIHPDDELILSLSPPTRSKLYGKLAYNKINHYMRFPFCYPGRSAETLFQDSSVAPSIVALVKQLLYPRGDALCFSDYEMVLRRAPDEEERIDLIKTLSRQSAVQARLRIRRDTDVDKLLGYWGRGAQVKDIRPLLESLKRLPEGGSAHILYLLPQFARQRLYTFPLPSKLEETTESCHWSTLNFFNETPDDRFANSDYISAYLATNYFQVARPTLYGDVVFLLDARNEAVHSAVHIAADIVFTKNGNNYAQPWMLMHLKDLLAMYTMDTPPQVVVYRSKNS